MNAKPKRRWFQFSLRTLLLLVPALALLLGLVAKRRMIAERHDALRADGLEVVSAASQPLWRIWVLGDDSLGYATEIGLTTMEVTDAGSAHLEGLTRLRTLNIASTLVTDAGLRISKG